MTNRPRLALENSLAPGLLAVALFVLMALVTLNTAFGETAGFPDGISITSELGYAMFDLEALQSTEGAIGDTEPFLVAFLLIAVVLDAALDASLVLAKREEGGEPVSPLSSDSDVSSTDAAGATGAAVADGGRTSSPDSDGDDGGERR